MCVRFPLYGVWQTVLTVTAHHRERPFEGEDMGQRVYATVLHAREPMIVSEIAERADCSAESARTHFYEL